MFPTLVNRSPLGWVGIVPGIGGIMPCGGIGPPCMEAPNGGTLTPGGAGKGILPIMGFTIPEKGSGIDGLAAPPDSIFVACFTAFFFEVAIGFPFKLGQM